MKQTKLGILLYVILIIPPITTYMESIMLVHMLIQFPLLILAGWLIGEWVLERWPYHFLKWDANGIAGIILVIFITTYWMFPRAMDESLTIWHIELFKFISLPLVGILLRNSWRKLTIIGRSFVFLNYLSMFGLMGWFYIDSPVQICNNYLEIEQQMLGWGFVVITGIMIVYVLQKCFISGTKSNVNQI
ncbi:DUF1404 domain-containing protein [Cerasibacillus terrae]|uniref:DUF1404 domain-containing protein n=1 Tax=Cerasibacillus terrae TaxID=2498845 RepID=A0A5C8NZC4_9BACI|nr:DUF1404 family protein [Cerasibacillus terrae]TXL66668.1 DUF1404 domain-containing protein [Cerasibacillus terrae]